MLETCGEALDMVGRRSAQTRTLSTQSTASTSFTTKGQKPLHNLHTTFKQVVLGFTQPNFINHNCFCVNYSHFPQDLLIQINL